MSTEFQGQTIVLAGASSGIGRATAHALAERGATLVLAARGERALEELAGTLRGQGVTAVAVPTDVADAGAVEALADRAVAETGRVDGWVNLAGTAVYGWVDEVTAEEYDRVTRVTYLGTVHGTKAAARVMRATGGGTIVNVASVLGTVAVPLASAYVAAKHAVIGFTDSYRMELLRQDDGIRIGLVLPSSIDTPFFLHARSKLDHEPAPYPPVYAAQIVAEAIVSSLRTPRRRLVVGGAGRALALTNRLNTALTDWVLVGPGRAFDLQQSPDPNDGRDAFTEPMNTGTVVSGRQKLVLQHSPWTRLVEQAPAPATLVAGVAAALVSVFRRR